MVVPCIPCAAAAVPTVSTSLATVFGVGATVVAAKKLLKTKKKKKSKRKYNKKDKKDKKKDKKSMKGGSLKKDMSKIYKKFRKCNTDCYKERNTEFKKPFGISVYEWEESLSPEEKKKYKTLHRKATKCSRNCRKTEIQHLKEHKKKYSKEYREMNKKNKKNCCKCRYVKSGSSLRKVRGPYSHCSYDMQNCCKDKKTIVKSKK